MKLNTKKLAMTAVFAALTCAATFVIRIPSPLHGYINLGDCIVLVSSWLLGPLYGFLAAGIGSALADVFAGCLVYAPATFVIKGRMVVTAYFTFKVLSKTKISKAGYLISAVAAEIVMVLGYFIFEGFLYGFRAVLVNIPYNAVQGAAGVVIGTLMIAVINKTQLNKKL